LIVDHCKTFNVRIIRYRFRKNYQHLICSRLILARAEKRKAGPLTMQNDGNPLEQSCILFFKIGGNTVTFLRKIYITNKPDNLHISR